MTRSWFVCQSNPREEPRAKYYLEEKGFEVYLPMMEAERFTRAGAVKYLKPLFPSYLFVRFDVTEEVAYARWTRGVRKILPESDAPVALEDSVIDSVRSLAQRDGIIRKRPLRKSDRVRILRGPFKDLIGIFEEWASDEGRVRILLEMVSYQATVELHHSLVARVA
jgi:transcriptional antiterminator RfaH